VKEPLVGSHDWVVSFDLDSLYPHLIMQYNLSPDTKVVDRQGRASSLHGRGLPHAETRGCGHAHAGGTWRDV
jgi:DNA polymerase elongation subunit (family B)